MAFILLPDFQPCTSSLNQDKPKKGGRELYLTPYQLAAIIKLQARCRSILARKMIIRIRTERSLLIEEEYLAQGLKLTDSIMGDSTAKSVSRPKTRRGSGKAKEGEEGSGSVIGGGLSSEKEAVRKGISQLSDLQQRFLDQIHNQESLVDAIIIFFLKEEESVVNAYRDYIALAETSSFTHLLRRVDSGTLTRPKHMKTFTSGSLLPVTISSVLLVPTKGLSRYLPFLEKLCQNTWKEEEKKLAIQASSLLSRQNNLIFSSSILSPLSAPSSPLSSPTPSTISTRIPSSKISWFTRWQRNPNKDKDREKEKDKDKDKESKDQIANKDLPSSRGLEGTSSIEKPQRSSGELSKLLVQSDLYELDLRCKSHDHVQEFLHQSGPGSPPSITTLPSSSPTLTLALQSPPPTPSPISPRVKSTSNSASTYVSSASSTGRRPSLSKSFSAKSDCLTPVELLLSEVQSESANSDNESDCRPRFERAQSQIDPQKGRGRKTPPPSITATSRDMIWVRMNEFKLPERKLSEAEPPAVLITNSPSTNSTNLSSSSTTLTNLNTNGSKSLDPSKLESVSLPGTDRKRSKSIVSIQTSGDSINKVKMKLHSPSSSTAQILSDFDVNVSEIEASLFKSKLELLPEDEACVTDKLKRQRNQCINEILLTEKDYIIDMEVLMRRFREPMREAKILSEKDLGAIFSNIGSLINVNKRLFEDLQHQIQTSQESPSIGATFLVLSSYLKMYSAYCSNQQSAMEVLKICARDQLAFRNFLQARHQTIDAGVFTLRNYLIKPVQRICKYPLLLRELLRFTKEDDEDFKQLVEAHSNVESVVGNIEQNSEKIQNIQKIIEIQSRFEISGEKLTLVEPTRRLIREGILREQPQIHHNKASIILLQLLSSESSSSLSTSTPPAALTSLTQEFTNEREVMYYLFNDLLIRGISLPSSQSGVSRENTSPLLKRRPSIGSPLINTSSLAASERSSSVLSRGSSGWAKVRQHWSPSLRSSSSSPNHLSVNGADHSGSSSSSQGRGLVKLSCVPIQHFVAARDVSPGEGANNLQFELEFCSGSLQRESEVMPQNCHHTIVLMAPSIEEKRDWIEQLQSCICKSQTTHVTCS